MWMHRVQFSTTVKANKSPETYRVQETAGHGKGFKRKYILACTTETCDYITSLLVVSDTSFPFNLQCPPV